MMEKCPLCDTRLQIGKDEIKKEYDPEYKAKFVAGEITLDELLLHVHQYRYRTMLCPNTGNENTYTDEYGKVHLSNPPCQNYYGRNGGTLETPNTVVDTIKIEDL